MARKVNIRFMGFHTESFPVCQQCSQLKSMKTGSAILTLVQPLGSLLLKAQVDPNVLFGSNSMSMGEIAKVRTMYFCCLQTLC